jgi:hypothetical protein
MPALVVVKFTDDMMDEASGGISTLVFLVAK